MKILGIETSCDETAAAVVENGTRILSNIVASSAEMHEKTGGVIPEEAARQQVKSILLVINESLKNAKQTPGSLDAIAVTVGPGLIGSLLVGVETSKTLAYIWKKPIIPVNHLVAHIYANWLTDKPINRNTGIPNFPALALVVSGGHTDLVLMKGHTAPANALRKHGRRGKIKWIGGTRDDAAGEAFDKSARLLGLPYPGGPSISLEANKYLNQQRTTNNIQLNMFPRPLLHEDNFDWSFSGLKTALFREAEVLKHKTGKIPKKEIPRLAAEVQEAIVEVLVQKSAKAIKKFRPKSFLLAGGVAANKRLREKIKEEVENLKLDTSLFVPPPNLCTDNATYIAGSAFYNYHPLSWQKIVASPELRIFE